MMTIRTPEHLGEYYLGFGGHPMAIAVAINAKLKEDKENLIGIEPTKDGLKVVPVIQELQAKVKPIELKWPFESDEFDEALRSAQKAAAGMRGLVVPAKAGKPAGGTPERKALPKKRVVKP